MNRTPGRPARTGRGRPPSSELEALQDAALGYAWRGNFHVAGAIADELIVVDLEDPIGDLLFRAWLTSAGREIIWAEAATAEYVNGHPSIRKFIQEQTRVSELLAKMASK